MITLAIARSHADRISREVLRGDTERCVVLFASRAQRSDTDVGLIVKDIDTPGLDDYASRSLVSAELTPAYVAKVTKRARLRGESLVFVHSHPGDEPPSFSPVDDFGEGRLAKFLAGRTPGVPHGAVLISAGGWRGRQLGNSHPMTIVALGQRREVLFDAGGGESSIPVVFDRQVRAFGAAGQRVLSSLTVAIVGLGGTGSIVAELLAHLGVRRFILINPDVLDVTNLNRVVGASLSDVGRPKVELATDHLMEIAPASVSSIQGDVTRTSIARELIAADFVFSCTDSHGSRAVIQQMVYQYFIPCIDVGSVITAADGQVSGIHGRVQALGPDLACFTCSGLIDPEEVRRDMMSADERHRDPYILGAREPAPAVISLNGTVTSLAITMFMAIMVGIPSDGRYILYNAKRPSLRSVAVTAHPTCYICSPSGVLARGDSQALFTRDE